MCTASPTLGDIFESSNLKARTSLLPHFNEKRRSSFELWALNQHLKMSPQVGSAVQMYQMYQMYEMYSTRHVQETWQGRLVSVYYWQAQYQVGIWHHTVMTVMTPRTRGPGRSLESIRYECNFSEHIRAHVNLNALCCLKQDWSKIYGLRETHFDSFSYYPPQPGLFPSAWPKFLGKGEFFRQFSPELGPKEIVSA